MNTEGLHCSPPTAHLLKKEHALFPLPEPSLRDQNSQPTMALWAHHMRKPCKHFHTSDVDAEPPPSPTTVKSQERRLRE